MSNIKTIKLIDPTGRVFGVVQTNGVIHQIVDSSALPDGAATSEKQLEDGHDVAMLGYTGVSMQYPRLDSSTFALSAIEYEHHEIHGKRSFACHYTQEVSDTGDKSIIAFKTPDTDRGIHIVMSIAAQDAALAYILEAPTITDNAGATLTVFNRYRDGTLVESGVIDRSQNPDAANAATFFTEATMGAVTSGTKLEEVQMIVGQGPRTLGGSARGSQEWVLKRNTLYAFVIESLNANDNLHNIRLDWYEHTPKEG